ncbi:MAG: hypothetical protein M3N24_04560, partial [Actinomycetota bacterium]|nr:hypothetical protein [Actinomycetota bacterium]
MLAALSIFRPAHSALAEEASNDEFTSAVAISGRSGSVNGTNVDFTGEPDEPDNAGVSSPIQSAWYVWTAPSTAAVVFQTCATEGLDTTLAVYRGAAVDALSLIAEDDDGCEGTTQSRLRFV